ncbi:hypothetical protein, partial [Chloroflexus sp.]|uniref:hypothetical protein n=1 Tax=Chloroflexus sp. TaxID=1904827 RepID=UPI002ACE0A00
MPFVSFRGYSLLPATFTAIYPAPSPAVRAKGPGQTNNLLLDLSHFGLGSFRRFRHRAALQRS